MKTCQRFLIIGKQKDFGEREKSDKRVGAKQSHEKKQQIVLPFDGNAMLPIATVISPLLRAC